jgi:hypothetical protein
MNTSIEDQKTTSQRLSLKSLLIPLLKQPRVAQLVKWSVYLLLLFNFGIYALDDWQVYNASLAADASLNKILETFATTIDMAAWVGLVILLELETYILPDEAFEGWTIKIVTFIRFLCYILIIYAAYGYTANSLDNYKIRPVPEVTDLCDIAKKERYLQVDTINFEKITEENCVTLSSDSEFLKIDENISLIGKSTIGHVQVMGWLDVINAIVWISVVLLIELEISLQNADKFGTRTLALVRQIKTPLYGILFLNAGIWVATGYLIYAWDACLWIIGFWAIELNLAEWEQDRTEELSI